jgi:hypothetical protein
MHLWNVTVPHKWFLTDGSRLPHQGTVQTSTEKPVERVHSFFRPKGAAGSCGGDTQIVWGTYMYIKF